MLIANALTFLVGLSLVLLVVTMVWVENIPYLPNFVLEVNCFDLRIVQFGISTRCQECGT